MRRRFILAVSVLVLAFSAGHVMQNVLAEDTDLAVRGAAPDALDVIERAVPGRGLPVPPAATLVPFEAPQPHAQDRITDDPPLPVLPLEDASLKPLEEPCERRVDAIVGDLGIIWLEIHAPCLAETRVQVSHGGLDVGWTLDAEGRLSADLPALAEAAVVTVRFADDTDHSLFLAVKELRDLFRAGLQWEGAHVLTLHAFEFDATYGAPGHVHAGAPGEMSRDAGRGFLMRLGDGSGPMAEVYTFPGSDVSRRGRVRLSAEAEVTSATCGLRVEADALQSDRFGAPVDRRITLAMPSCDNLGDIVSIDRLFQDFQIAAR